jgi:alpha-1,3-rhamnosyl/mannosyltransferase
LGADEITQEIARQGLTSSDVRITGFVPAKDLVGLMASATALVHPSVYEGFGLTPLEAMAVGTPVIVSNGGALPEIVRDAGILVEPENADAWAAAMATISADSAARDRLRLAGRRRARDFSWERTAKQTVAIYREVLGMRVGGEDVP